MDGDSGQSPMVVLPVSPPPEPKLLVPINTGKSKGHSRGGHNARNGHDDSDGPPAWLIFLVVALLILVVLSALGMFFRGGSFWDGWSHHRSAYACPRPAPAVEEQPQFNAQQRDIRNLRRRAFRGDFFAQLELGSRYEGRHAADKNLQDPVEAAVWYSLALSNPDGYSVTGERDSAEPFGDRHSSLYDDCRRVERDYAYGALDRLLGQMSTDERDKVRDRATYVLSTQGGAGLRTLGRLHDIGYGPFGEPSDDVEARHAWARDGWRNAVQLFGRNGVDAYMYDYLAMQGGDEAAFVLLKDVERTSGQPGLADAAEERARRWVPPVEFYPPDAPDSGVPHSDESEPYGEVERISLYRIGELPFRHIAEALTYLHVTHGPVDREQALSGRDVEAFQAMLGRPVTGRLTPLEKVRAIQFAAINGSPHAQLVLAVMYAQGVGVPPDYARAFHWFEQADRQGSPEAKFAIATYFSEGLAGVADQEKAEAVVHQLDAALSGFRPSVDRLRGMLQRVSPGRRRGWLGYARPEEQAYDAGPYPPDGYADGPASGDPSAGFGSSRPGDPAAGYGPSRPGDPAAGYGPPRTEDFSRAAGDTRRRVSRRPPARTRSSNPTGAPAPYDERGPR